MASTSVTTVGGVMIVTQVIPKDGSSIPLQAPANPSPQAPPPEVAAPPPLSKKDSKAAMFLRSEQQGLGIVQIFIGLLCILFALTAVYLPPLMIYAPFGLGAVFVVSGSVAVAAGRRTSTRLVCVSLVSNVLSILLGLVGGVYLCLLFVYVSPRDMICRYLTEDMPTTTLAPTTTPIPTTSSRWDRYRYRNRYQYDSGRKPRPVCPEELYTVREVLFGLQGLFLVLLVLQVCVSVTICVLSGKILKRRKHYSPVSVEADSSSLLPPGSPEFSEDERKAEMP
ncbi:membrane-spanning 4-domains subfamily A member 15 [Kryptolebias marmoratus]|uniref:membrane-spanning 4-domains subfamily A member 15 n=1 Tax=Kryptolebias marmoratus TaxID=37003 RepID=UPI0007F8D518|nr:membrane-spanning 4-domains subfamily A member 15 [Kryptolebias marmoratus]XP_024858708.1 membrane-spanning 4-domains subfamily A member 15 [Kryptolebias marmoratus]